MRKALTAAYVEMMSGLTQGYLTDKVKHNPGSQVELPKKFKSIQEGILWFGVEQKTMIYS